MRGKNRLVDITKLQLAFFNAKLYQLIYFFHMWLLPNRRSHTALAGPFSTRLDGELILEQFSRIT